MRLLVLSGLSLLVFLTLAGTASARTYYPDCNYKPVAKPKKIQVGCVAILRQLDKLKWYRWGGSNARARARYRYQTCEPTCVSGKVRRLEARVVLSRKRYCSYSRKTVYTRLTIIARGEPRTPYKLRCRPR